MINVSCIKTNYCSSNSALSVAVIVRSLVEEITDHFLTSQAQSVPQISMYPSINNKQLKLHN